MKYDAIIRSASIEYKIDYNLIKAIITIESAWKPDAKRHEPKINDTSYGLMQVLVKTAKWVTNNQKITPAQLKDPTLNILVGVRYLAYLKKKYKTMDNTIAAYNAGKPIRSKKDPRVYINQRYVDKVKKVYNSYQSKKAPIGIGIIGIVAVALLASR